MRIDCYGKAIGDGPFAKGEPHEPLETRFEGGYTYLRFGAGNPAAVHRLGLGADGVVRRDWAWGRWEDAARLDYVPETETREVDG